MKKIIVGILVLCCLLSCLTGCGNNGSSGGKNSDNNSKENNTVSSVDNNSGYEIKILDDTFTFPCKYKDMKKAGYTISSDDENKILSSTSGDKEFVNAIYGDKELFGMYIIADGGNIDNAKVVGVKITASIYEDEKFYIEGLELGKATVNDVISKLGKPEEPETYDESAYILSLVYQNKTVSVNFISGVLNSVYVLGEKI